MREIYNSRQLVTCQIANIIDKLFHKKIYTGLEKKRAAFLKWKLPRALEIPRSQKTEQTSEKRGKRGGGSIEFRVDGNEIQPYDITTDDGANTRLSMFFSRRRDAGERRWLRW